jgi:hypothetical protein
LANHNQHADDNLLDRRGRARIFDPGANGDGWRPFFLFGTLGALGYAARPPGEAGDLGRSPVLINRTFLLLL